MSFFFEIPQASNIGYSVWESDDPCMQCTLRSNKECGWEVGSSGAEEPLIYFVGEAPGETEVEKGVPFIGKSGQYLRRFIPAYLLKKARFGNAVRCRPSNNATPTLSTMERCKEFVLDDIAKTKPKVVVALGKTAYEAIMPGISSSRTMSLPLPLEVGNHSCWLMPTLHPAFILRNERSPSGLPESGVGRAFLFDLKKAFSLLNEAAPAILKPDKTNLCLVHAGSKYNRTYFDILDLLDNEESVACDLETTALRPYSTGAFILSIAIGVEDCVIAASMDLRKYNDWRGEIIERIEALLLNNKIIKVFHNAIFDLEWLGVVLGKKFVRGVRAECSLSQAYILDTGKSALDLDTLLMRYFGMAVKPLTNLNVASLATERIEDTLEYNALDVKYTHKLYKEQRARILYERRVNIYKRQIKRIPTFVLAQMEGVLVSKQAMRESEKRLNGQIEEVKKRLRTNPDHVKWHLLKGHEINFASTKQVGEFFHEILKRPEVISNTVMGYSVSEDVLQKIDHPVAKDVLELRRLTKVLNTYIEAYRANGWIHPDGKLHCNYNLTRTVTGRTSSSNPNMQNWPARKDKWVRDHFVAPPGFKYLKADQGQIEARIIGVHSKDKYYCSALKQRYDIHMEWTQKIAYAYPPVVGGKKFLKDEKVLSKFRTIVKNAWTFPAFYGAQPKSIAEYLGISDLDLVYKLFDEFWTTFRGVKTWQHRLVAAFNKSGYVESLTGRRRYAPMDLNKILNSPIQGDASDVVVEAMDELSEKAHTTGIGYLQPVLNIHDDLTFLVPEDKVEEALEQIVPVMLFPEFDWLDVPLSVECELGDTLGSTKPIGTFFSDDL